jgi:ActR/RegA family two-component response regulator
MFMPKEADPLDTILIVDDEEPVRQTFHEWLEGAGFPCRILAAADAEAALVQANCHIIDLAILDWNLGAGNDGLRLLEDLYVFNPDVVAILVTGFAHQATPLDAMRMGVRDYLDKNQDLDRDSFLVAVTRQLERIRPAKRERWLHRSLAAFREAVEKILPLVQSAAALNDPVPLSQAIHSLLQFLVRMTGASDAVLVVRSYSEDRSQAEIYQAYGLDGSDLGASLVPFARSLAGSVVSIQEPCVMSPLTAAGAVELQTFEHGRQSLLAAPVPVGPGTQVVLELFDKQTGNAPRSFTAEDQRTIAAGAEFGGEMLRQALAERQTHRVLFDAVEAALGASDAVTESLRIHVNQRTEEPPPPAVLDSLREGLRTGAIASAAPDETLQLAEAVRVLAIKHGPAALQYCVRLVQSVRELLDRVTDPGENRP